MRRRSIEQIGGMLLEEVIRLITFELDQGWLEEVRRGLERQQ